MALLPSSTTTHPSFSRSLIYYLSSHITSETGSEESALNPYGFGQIACQIHGLASRASLPLEGRPIPWRVPLGCFWHIPLGSVSPQVKRPGFLLSLLLARWGHQSYLPKRTARQGEKEIKGTLRCWEAAKGPKRAKSGGRRLREKGEAGYKEEAHSHRSGGGRDKSGH